jgi:hypothetical protein
VCAAASPLSNADDEVASCAFAAACGSFPDRSDVPAIDFEVLAPESVSDTVSISDALASWSVSTSRASAAPPFSILAYPRDDLVDQYVERRRTTTTQAMNAPSNPNAIVSH